MAYSTQKVFFHVPFMNEKVDRSTCLEKCVKLKSYPSTIDDRSWAAGEVKQSRFVSDRVSCNIPIISGGNASNSVPERQSQNQNRGGNGGPRQSSLRPSGKSQNQVQGDNKQDRRLGRPGQNDYWHPRQAREGRNRTSYEDLLNIREH